MSNTEAASIVAVQDRLMVSGDLNFSTVPLLWQQSLPLLAVSPALYFDFTKITSSNSAGLALLIEWLKYAKKSQKNVKFNNMPAQLKSIIEAAGVHDFLDAFLVA